MKSSQSYDFQPFTLPGVFNPIAYGINDFGTVTGIGSNIGAFIESNGSITAPRIPLPVVIPLAINNLGQVVGELTLSDGRHPFAVAADGTILNGYFIGLPPAEFFDKSATGINDFGQVVGQFTGLKSGIPVSTITDQFGFIDNPGTPATRLTLPDGSVFMPTGINDFDQIVGTTKAGTSYVLNLHTDKATEISVPGAASTDATAINNLGQVAGTYTDPEGTVRAFVDTHGHFNFLQFPESLSGTLQSISAINDLGQLVGQYALSDGTMESFIAAPSDLNFGHGRWLDIAATSVGRWGLDLGADHISLPADIGKQ